MDWNSRFPPFPRPPTPLKKGKITKKRNRKSLPPKKKDTEKKMVKKWEARIPSNSRNPQLLLCKLGSRKTPACKSTRICLELCLRPQYPLLGFCFRVVLLLSTLEFVTIFRCFQGFNANQSFSILTFVGVYLGYANMIDRILSSGGIFGEVRFGRRKKRCHFFGGFILQVVLQNLAHLITFIEG